jgi:ABC-type lipoprotein release transport system permease subunit
MKEEFTIAWRNLWRNRRRTLITSASVFFAVFFAVIMRSYQLGSYDHMINSFIQSFTGYMQIQHKEYQNSPVIDHSFAYGDSLPDDILKTEKVISVAPRLESFTLASSGSQTKGVAVTAIDPEKEKHFSDPESKMVKFRITGAGIQKLEGKRSVSDAVMARVKENLDRSYSSVSRLELELELSEAEKKLFLEEIKDNFGVPNSFLSRNDEGILVSDRLATYLKVSIGDSVILMGQGYHGASATGIFPVRGIIKMPSPEIDNKLIIMTIPAAQKFFGVEGKITSLAINLTDKSERTMRSAEKEIKVLLSDGQTVIRTWSELNPILYQQIQGDSQSGMAMLGILYFIIFFGIFGTVMMMVSERRREFGVMVAIGMQKWKLRRVIRWEMFLLGIFGLLSGLLASVPFILYFYYNPILLKGEMGKMMEDYGWDAVMPMAWFGPYFYWQAVWVMLMIWIAAWYAMHKVRKMKVIEALRG